MINFEVGDKIFYTCGRHRTLCSYCSGCFISEFYDKNYKLININKFSEESLNHQIDNGDIEKVISSCGKLKYLKNMKMHELKSGMRVKLKDEQIYLVIYSGKQFTILNKTLTSIQITEDIKNAIIVVYKQFEYDEFPFIIPETDVIWKKPETIELTMQEIAEKFNIPLSQLRIKNGNK